MQQPECSTPCPSPRRGENPAAPPSVKWQHRWAKAAAERTRDAGDNPRVLDFDDLCIHDWQW